MKKPTYEELEKRVAELEALLSKALDRIAELESQLKQNSSNSSKPPSTDRKPNLPKSKAKQRRPFHPGASRELLPESQVTSREQRVVDCCPRCHSTMKPTGAVAKWQQVELPEIKALVHQFELHECRCPNCNMLASPTLEPHEQLLLGPRMEALVNLCMGQFRQSHRQVREFLSTLIPELQLSQGLISKIKRRSAKALQAVTAHIRDRVVASSGALHLDATGWRHCGQNEYAVVLRSGNLVSFALMPRQNGTSVAELIGRRKVTHLVTDRGMATSKLDVIIHQYCLAHLLRTVQGLAEHSGTTLSETSKLGEFYDTVQELFHDKHRVDRGEISVQTWRQYGYSKWVYLRELVEDMLEANPSAKVQRVCKRLLKDWDHFRVYLRNRDSPMTNNPAEESLRNLVISRKLCFGSRSGYGRSWRASLQSCIESLRRSGQSVLDFLADALSAARRNSPLEDLPV